MNTANKLTMLRVLLIPVFLLLLYLDFEHSQYYALAVFVLASITDGLDGFIARRHNQITDFGKFMDPLADKVLTFAAMIWFVEVNLMPAWLVLIVIIREFFVTAIRLVAVTQNRVIAASIWGKIKTAVTMVCLILMFLPLHTWMLVICWILIGSTTVISGAEYFYKNKDIMKLDMK